MSLDNFSDEDLKRELERRRSEALPSPRPNPEPDFEAVRKLAIEYRNEIAKPRDLRRGEDKVRYYIFEAVIEAVFGKEFWPWHNKRV